MQTTDIAGLTSAEAARRLETTGRNELPVIHRTGVARKLRDQLADPLVLVLIAAAALTVLTGDMQDTVVIMIVVVLNTAVGVAQEVRADRAMDALSQLSAPTARVMRDGVEVVVPAAEVVPDDVVLLVAGDIVPADGTLVDAHSFQADESALTGESVPVELALGSTVHAGTVVTRGRGRAAATATGTSSALGRIAELLGESGSTRTPLQRKLAELGRILAGVAAVVCGLVLVMGLARGESLELMIVTAISLAVAAVPESLPIVTTLALALGAHRMAQHQALVRRLPAVETLGSVTVLTTDKTGTLTEGRMVAQRTWTPDLGGRLLEEAPLVAVTRPDRSAIRRSLAALLEAGVLCNDGDLVEQAGLPGGWAGIGDPTETALLELAERYGVDRAAVTQRHPRLAEIPFDSSRRRMTTLHRDAGALLVVVKGASDVVLTRVRDEPAGIIAEAKSAADQLEGEGFRVLVVATKSLHNEPERLDSVEVGLSLAGLVAIADPPRSDAREWIDACHAAGIRVILLTGDSPGTATAIARRVGLADGSGVVTGVDLQVHDDVDLDRVGIVARVSAEQKVEIVQALQRRGEVVAMTGDGVNDGPALRQADIGVAMGARGTEVAKQAADLVLLDDSLGTLAVAVEEGRRVYSNVRRFLRYGLSGGAAELILMLAGPLMGLSVPLIPAQILWVNLLTHGLPGVALGAEPGEPGTMTRSPRSSAEGVLGDHLWRQVLLLGAWLATVCLAVGFWAHSTDRPWQTMIFVLLGLLQLGVAVGLRSRPGRYDRQANPMLLVAVAVAAGLQLAAVYAAPLQALLSTEPLSASDLLVVLAAGSLGYLSILASRLWRPPHTHQRQVSSAKR